MSTIDLERLIVKQRYLVPSKASELQDAVLTELRRGQAGTPLYKLKIFPWTVKEQRKNSFVCSRFFAFDYLMDETHSDFDKESFAELVKKKLEEYEAGAYEKFGEMVKRLRSNMPIDLCVRITDAQENECRCKVECFSNLYLKLSKGMVETQEVRDFDIQDAFLTCRRFIEDIFEGGLSATFISEEKKEVAKPASQFLINYLESLQITEKLNQILDNATTEILVFGWIGTFYLKKFRELKAKGVEIKVVTGNVTKIRQDPMRKEKERAINHLIKITGKENISIKPEFHGRAIVVDNKALIGSMDLDSYSLTGTRIEFATYTENPEIVRGLRNYFNRIFVPWKGEKKAS